jgi:hypothetical protein
MGKLDERTARIEQKLDDLEVIMKARHEEIRAIYGVHQEKIDKLWDDRNTAVTALKIAGVALPICVAVAIAKVKGWLGIH